MSQGQNMRIDIEADSWFVLKEEKHFGPFNYLKIVKMLQEKVIFDFDLIWKEGMETWKRLAEVADFSDENIQSLMAEKKKATKEVFVSRKNKRVHFKGTALIHDNEKMWKGDITELSCGGIGVVMENSMMVPGQTIYLHFKSSDGLPAFNAICEIVYKKYNDNIKGEKAPACYGLKFKNLKNEMETSLKKYTANPQLQEAAIY